MQLCSVFCLESHEHEGTALQPGSMEKYGNHEFPVLALLLCDLFAVCADSLQLFWLPEKFSSSKLLEGNYGVSNSECLLIDGI